MWYTIHRVEFKSKIKKVFLVTEDLHNNINAYTLEAHQPIGVMDSGLGGISVLREVCRLIPHEDCIFYGDSAHAPYGDKSLAEIRQLTERVVEKLMQQRVKAVVLACNTASSAAGAILREKYPWLPIIAIEPALKPAVLHKPNSRVLVLATSTTLREKKFHNLMSFYADKAEIISMPLPGLPEFVERGELDSAALREFLRSHFDKLGDKKIDSAVLGCTHYPFVRKVIQELLGDDVAIFDGAAGTSRQLRRILTKRNLLNIQKCNGFIHWQNSSTAPKYMELSKQLFNLPLTEL